MSEDSHKVTGPSDFDALERTLASLAPLAPMKSRNQLLYEAGRASTREPYLILWQAAAIGFGMLSLILGLFLLWPSEPQVIERERIVIQYQVRDREPVPSSPIDEPGTVSIPLTPTEPESVATTPDESFHEEARKMLRVRNEVLRFGVEMLPRTGLNTPVLPPQATGEPTRSEALEGLEFPRGIFASPFPSRPRVESKQEE